MQKEANEKLFSTKKNDVENKTQKKKQTIGQFLETLCQ